MTQKTYSIEEIEQKKRDLNKLLDKKRNEISETYATFFEEEESDSHSQRLMSNFSRFITVADSFWMGYKLYRRFSPYLRKRNKKIRR